MKFQSHAAAVATLRGFFANHPGADVVSLHDIYLATGRDLDKLKLNKTWVANKLTHLKHYQLIEPIYSHSPNNRKILDKVQLTPEGTAALNQSRAITPPTARYPTATPVTTVTLESIAQDIKVFTKQNPSLQIELIIRLKDDLSTP